MFSKKLMASVFATACATAFTAAFAAAPLQVAGSVGDVPFPNRDRSYLPQGDFVNIDNLRQMKPGLSKDQVRLLLGHPHFKEGLFGVDEWNYIFNFRTGIGEEYITCQYQVRYEKRDGRYMSKSLHWDGPACLDLANRPEPVAAAPAAKPAETHVNLSADALFPFARSGRSDILPPGREQLGALAENIRDKDVSSVKVIGHTDPIGSDADNLALSRRRAESVRGYLIDHGVPASKTNAEGRGESEQVKQCGNLPRRELIACLAPNRRVEIVVTGSVL